MFMQVHQWSLLSQNVWTFFIFKIQFNIIISPTSSSFKQFDSIKF